MRADPEMMAKRIPTPRSIRAMMYIPTEAIVNRFDSKILRMHTMYGETLEKSTDDHDDGTGHDTPPSAPALIAVRSNGNRKNRSELVAGRNKSEERWLDGPFVILVLESTSEVFVERLRELKRIDELGIESARHLDPHALMVVSKSRRIW